jgi:hypothetical protein
LPPGRQVSRSTSTAPASRTYSANQRILIGSWSFRGRIGDLSSSDFLCFSQIFSLQTARRASKFCGWRRCLASMPGPCHSRDRKRKWLKSCASQVSIRRLHMAFGRCLRPALYSSLRSSPSHPMGVSALRVTIAIASAANSLGFANQLPSHSYFFVMNRPPADVFLQAL